MAILKFINDLSDFTANNASVSTNTAYFDALRGSGWGVALDESLTAVWPEDPGTTVWMHFILGQSTSNTAWSQNDFFRFYDTGSVELFSVGLRSGLVDWNLKADSTVSLTYPAIADALLIFDVQFIKNGTTDLTLNIYINGAFQGTLTAANTADKGVPTNFLMTNTDTIGGGSVYFGECVITNEDTRGWRLYQLKPIAYGVHQEWDGSVSTVIDGSLLTGISTDVADELVSFGVTNIENIPDTALIDRVAVQTHAQRGATGLTSINHYFRYENATIVHDANVSLGLTVQLVLDEYTLNPNTAAAWATADIQGLQIGVRARA